MQLLKHPILTHLIAAAVPLLMYFLWTDGDYEWRGLDLTAEINDRAEPRLLIPADYSQQPSVVYARGSVVNSVDPTSLPIPFKVRLTQIDSGSTDQHKIILLQDVRPLICQALSTEKCSDYRVVNLVLEATFPRGDLPATIEKMAPIPLSIS
ncbi:hypothetical protein [Roseobacter sinensis]|uniref:Uncharacterized protein n=1 Tax=Roseobacter sinensis TaxID=2931391 RepID=A0ABT3BCF8_9RHOB|nr:hypothetical protein [Roseobacter sp. WL0113]MCV3270818.1 hypothetical protein [Roseobacter sp. WL0113]